MIDSPQQIRRALPTTLAGLCRSCGMRGAPHVSTVACIDALRSRIADVEMKVASMHGQRVSERKRRAEA